MLDQRSSGTSSLEVMGGQRSRDVEEQLRRSRAELMWIQRQLSIISRRSSGHHRARDKLRSEFAALTTLNLERCHRLEEKNRALRLELATLRQERQRCRALKNELQHALQEKTRLSLELFGHSQRAARYKQVESEYEKLRETYSCVTQERDSAVQERTQLQGKLEHLEQVLQHMRKALDGRLQLEQDHAQALAVLHAKQQEIDLLQKAQLEAEKKYKGTVHLLEAKVQELEQKCRFQTEQFNLLSQQLEKCQLQTGGGDTLGPPEEGLSTFLGALASQVGKDCGGSSDNCVTPKKTGENKSPSTSRTQSQSGSPQHSSPPEMDDDKRATAWSEARYTGKVRLCTARYSYNPYDGPNEHPEAELPLVAGKYLYVYGAMDDDGFYQGELPDGQRGLVPSNFVEFVQDKDTTPVQNCDDGQQADLDVDGGRGPDADSDVAGNDGDLDVTVDELGDELVPFPRNITLIKQLAKSVIVGWDPPLVPRGWDSISSYEVLVDQEVRATVPFGERTKLLIEKLDLCSRAYRVSVRSVTARGQSDGLRCSLLVGCGVVLAPSRLRVDSVTQESALLSWVPSNSNYSHSVLLNGSEHVVIGPGRYRCRLQDLKPVSVYRVAVLALPHQIPWQLPLEQREKKEASLEFCTQAAGPPFPPQEVQVHCGQAPGLIHVHWRPPALTPTGMSNGASVTGYAVCTKGQRIAEVMHPAADYITVELSHIQQLEAREVVVRTLSVQGESQDSAAAVIPNTLLVPPLLPPNALLQPHPAEPRLQPHPLQHPPQPPQLHTVPQNEPYLQTQLPQPSFPLEAHLQPHPLHLVSQSQPHPHPHPLPPHFVSPPGPQSSVSGRDAETKDQNLTLAHPGSVPNQPWDLPYPSPLALPPSQLPGHTLEASLQPPQRSPSPQRILPQPRGAPIPPDTVAKAIAREAAQRVTADSGRSSDEEEQEEDIEESVQARRKRASMEEFLRGSELGRQLQRSHSEEYNTESSRGSDLSDILEEDEEELYSEMELGEGCRRGSSAHGTLQVSGTPPPPGGRSGPAEGPGQRSTLGGAQPRHKHIVVPSIAITAESTSEENLLSVTGVYRDAAETRIRARGQHHTHGPEGSSRIFVALFDYDPLSMSPNPDAADEELSFKEGQILQVFGEKDTDGFYRGELGGRTGLIPCNMVSEIQAEDKDTMEQLICQGFLPLSTPVDKIEQEQRVGRCPLVPTRKMVALYDYDPRESSPNVDVEAELTFSAGDIIAVLGDIDEDGFYYGEINGHRGLVPSNFLEEVPDDVEVYLTDGQTKTENMDMAEASGSQPPNPRISEPLPKPMLAGPAGPPGPPEANSATRDSGSKRKKGLLSKGKKLWKRLAVVKRAT
ncbi:RIMS-binding protein 2-like isoform X1 [Arapaima gigas]